MKNFLTLFLIWFSFGLSLHGQQPHYTAYGITSGLGRPNVSCVYQDSRDVLWVGTSGAGIYQFVLGRFSQNSTKPESTGYFITQINQDASGYLYFLSEAGLFRFDGRDILKISKSQSEIHCFAINKAGIWWATKDSIFLQKSSGNILKEQHTADILIPGLERDEQMFSMGPQGLSIVNEKLDIEERVKMPIPGNINYAWTGYTFDTDSLLWISSREGQLLYFNGFSTSIVNTSLVDVKDIAAGALGSLWIADQKGVSIYQPQDSTLISLQIAPAVNCLFFDRYNRLWLGSSAEGLIRYFGEQHRVWSIPKDAQKIFSGMQTEASMVSTHTGYMIPLGNSSDQIMPPDSNIHIQQLYRDVKSRIWALTENRLWMHYDTSWILMDSSGIVNGMKIVGSDDAGNIWFGDNRAIIRYGIKPVSFPIGVTFASKQITGTVPDDETVSILTNDKGQAFRVGSGSIGPVSEDHYKQTHRLGFKALSVDLDSAGYLWIGTEATGIFRVKPEGGHSIQALATMYPLRVSDIVFIKHTGNSLIAGTDRDILRIHTDTSGVRVTKVDVINEEAGISLNGLNRDRYAVTDDGHLLVMAGNEVIEFDLLHSDEASHSPSVTIGQIVINGTDMRDTRYHQLLGPFSRQLKMPEFAKSDNQLTFVFAGNSIEDEYLFYQWRLAGFQHDWSASTAEEEITFSGLAPGTYALDVRVCDAAGNCDEIAEPWHFVIRKALWHHVWFWPAIALLVLTGIWVVFRQRSKRQKREADREKKRLEAELNALTLEQKSLQLQMNPHFIFNALQAVRSHIHEDKLDDARTHLTRFAKLMRVMLEMSRSDKITLEDELEFLQAYVDVEKISHHLPVHFQIDIDNEIEPYAIEIPPMIIQPILENAIKYGGDGKEIKVDMRIKLHNKQLSVAIQDNGTGFGSHTPLHKSAALDIIKNRLAHLGKGGGLEISQSEEGGAVVELRIPV